MSKINFSKIESLTEKGLEQRKIDGIVNETRSKDPIAEEHLPKLYLIESLRYDVMEIPFYDPQFFKAIGIRKKEIISLIRNPSSLTDKDWQLVKEIHTKVAKRKEEIADLIPEPTDEDIIEYEKQLHIYKRFNVNSDWLPLH